MKVFYLAYIAFQYLTCLVQFFFIRYFKNITCTNVRSLPFSQFYIFLYSEKLFYIFIILNENHVGSWTCKRILNQNVFYNLPANCFIEMKCRMSFSNSLELNYFFMKTIYCEIEYTDWKLKTNFFNYHNNVKLLARFGVLH